MDEKDINQDEDLKKEDQNESPVEECESQNSESDENEKKIAELEEKCTKQHEEYLRLYAEFDNYRKRTIKEKADLIKSGGEKVILGLLPLVDDFERALKSMEDSSLKEGVDLIYNKFISFLESQGVKAIETEGQVFDTEFHEAITTIPAPSEDLKGKIIDCTQKGYTLNEKVIRYAKVVVGD